MSSCPHCGSRPRSSDDHRRLFALIAAAFEQWPETHEFEPEDAEHLRAWLLCKAGWKTTKTLELPEAGNPVFMALMMEFAEDLLERSPGGEFRFGRWVGHRLHVHTPKSIKFERADQKKFNPIRDAVTEIIEQVIGVSADQLLKEKAA